VNIHTILKSVLCFACLFFGIAHSAIITVNGTDGAVADDGFCSISEAIMAANDDASVSGAAGECNAGNGIDTLNLSTNIILDTVIENSTLGISGTPNISSTIIIDGMGFSVVRDTELECSLNGSPDSGEFRIITINDMGNLTLKNINLINGCADGIGKDFNDHDKGGSILNEGQLSIENSTLSGNQAFTDGGGIYNDGAIISIQNSTLSGNSAVAGGGIFNRSQISNIQNTTFSGNSASQGGVILNLFFITTLRNSLFHQNLTMNNDSECLSFECWQ